jgi:hypothetical protein
VFGVLGGNDVVGDDDHLQTLGKQSWCECFDECGLARTHGPTDSYATGVFHIFFVLLTVNRR